MNKIKILIIEDSIIFKELYNQLLYEDLFQKRFATNGVDGLRLYKEWKPEIILLDMVLPNMSGYSVLKEIRSKIKDKTTTIIVQTTLSGKDDVTDCIKLGIQGYIIKPPDPKTIILKILDYYQKVEPQRASEAKAAFENLKIVSQNNGSPMDETFTKEEEEYMEELKFFLKGGEITESHRRLLKRISDKLGIEGKRVVQLDSYVFSRSSTKYTRQELEYKESLKICLEKGPITDEERRILNRNREKLKISEARAQEIETEIE